MNLLRACRGGHASNLIACNPLPILLGKPIIPV